MIELRIAILMVPPQFVCLQIIMLFVNDKNEFLKKGRACIQWKFSLDTIGFGHMSKNGHVFTT